MSVRYRGIPWTEMSTREREKERKGREEGRRNEESRGGGVKFINTSV